MKKSLILLAASLLLFASCSTREQPEASKTETAVQASIEATSAQTSSPTPMQHGNSAGNILNWGIAALYEDTVYYQNTEDDYSIYKTPLGGGEKTKLNSDKSHYINAADGWVYYCNESDGWRAYRMRTDGSGREALNDIKSFDINVTGDTMFFINGNIYMNEPDSIYALRSVPIFTVSKDVTVYDFEQNCDVKLVPGDHVTFEGSDEKSKLIGAYSTADTIGYALLYMEDIDCIKNGPFFGDCFYSDTVEWVG